MRTCSCPEEATGGFASGSSCGLRTTLRILRPLKLFLLARSSRVSWLLSRIASARLVASSGVPRIAAGSSSRHRSRSVQSSTLSLMTARLVIIPNFDSKTARGRRIEFNHARQGQKRERCEFAMAAVYDVSKVRGTHAVARARAFPSPDASWQLDSLQTECADC
jgi:hypothetical protein